MDLKKVKAFIDLAKEEGLAELKYEAKDFKIALSFPTEAKISAMPIAQPISQVVAASTQEKIPTNTDCVNVNSPFVGTFYSAPSPGKAPYVKVGDRVSKGQTLCILEAMKIMNEIEAEVSGEVVEICIDNESLVEFGQTLFKIRES